MLPATWYFKMASIFQDGRYLSGAVKWCSVSDTSMRIGSSSLHGSLDKKQPIANLNFKMVDIFQDSHYLCRAVKICNHSVGDTLMKIGMMHHMTRNCSQPLEISRWQPFFEIATWKINLLQLDIMLQDPKSLRTPGTLLMVCSGASEIQMYIKVLST